MPSLMNDLRATIKASKLSLYSIADGAGVARSQLSRMMSGESDLSVETIEKLGTYLGFTMRLQERAQMTGNDAPGYTLLKNFVVKQMGGRMTYKGVGRGGIWTIVLWGRSKIVRVRNRRVNVLDAMYEPPSGKPNPETWDDWPKGDQTLRNDVAWRVVELLQGTEAGKDD
jgi:transcriptional regulator with XRE-family HTH domain